MESIELYLRMAQEYDEKRFYEEALVWYKKIENNPKVYERIGEYYYLGYGCGRDKNEAEKYFEKAAQYDNVDALCNLALCKNQLEEKLMLYKRAANQGAPYAMNMVGIILEELQNQESSQAIEWFKKSADAGYPVGCFNYAMNVGDPTEKMNYLKKAADKREVHAILKYAEYLEKGQYCEKDEKKAKQLRMNLTRVNNAPYNKSNY